MADTDDSLIQIAVEATLARRDALRTRDAAIWELHQQGWKLMRIADALRDGMKLRDPSEPIVGFDSVRRICGGPKP